MNDMIADGPNHDCLFDLASTQHGYFTSRQARQCGISHGLVAYHTQRGTFHRLRRGLYRLRHYPTSPREEVVAAWLSIPDQQAVVSHESALALLGLSDVIPNQVHLTVPRTRRKTPPLPGVSVHTSTRPLVANETTVRDGIKVTSATRSIVDAATFGTAPEQIILATTQAIASGLTTRRRLEAAASTRSARVRTLVAQALRDTSP